MKFTFIILLLFSVHLAIAQPKAYSTVNAHAHNDYVNTTPFYLAFNNGFGSIEADVFSINDTLFVAHNKQDIRPGRTLRNLYLNPIRLAFDSGRIRNLKLLIDIKDDYKVSLPLLVKELAPLKKYLLSRGNKGALAIIISGNRPPPAEFKNYPAFIFFDDDLKPSFSKKEWKKVALVSLPLTRITRWNGRDLLPAEDSIRLKKLIDSVHAAGKPIRFWAAPDNDLSWKTQMNLKVDLIGTDKIRELALFLQKK